MTLAPGFAEQLGPTYQEMKPMPKVTFVAHDGTSRTIEEKAGVSVMQAAQNAGIGGIVAECGGSMMCATCHVYVHEPWVEKLSKPDATENEMLTMTVSERRPPSTCRARSF